MSLFIIPTHRLCEKAFDSVMQEIDSVYKKQADVKLVVLDNSKVEIFKQNHEYLEKRKQKNLSVHIYHIGLDDMKNIIELVSKNSSLPTGLLSELLYPDKIDYGKIFNMIYLVTVLLGERGFHRRDSDCFVYDLSPEQYPINIEKKYLGQPENQVENVVRQEKLKYNSEERVCLVGGDYTGNWDVDMQKVAEANPNAMKCMMNICGIPKEDVDEQYEIKYQEEEEETTPVLCSLFEVSHCPECGNISMYDVFQYIPNFIGENGIGFDNHTYFTSFLVKTPIIFHFNRISHIHDENRTKDIKLLNYWKGVAKMVDFDCYHLAFINAGYGDLLCKEGIGIQALERTCQKEYPDLLEKVWKGLQHEERVERIEKIAEKVLRPTNITEYIEIADYLLQEKEHIVDQLDYEYKQSILLQRNWHEIIEAVRKISSSKEENFREI